MKSLLVLSLLFVCYQKVRTYSDCHGCNVISVEEGYEWGIENDDWCIIQESNCKKNDEKNKCFSFPSYPCCEGCDVVEEDSDGLWGVEKDSWCGLKESCHGKNDKGDNDGDTTSSKPKEPELEPLTNPGKICKSPLETKMYTADPAPMVYGDTLYVYTTHDEDNLKDNFYTMYDWYVFSTKDMVNWTNHGKIFSLNDISWADDRAWAPQCVERNGKFYLYCPVHKTNGGMAIAVGVSDSPTGPFKDIGHPLVDEGDWNDIDPTVLIDDDGQAYLYFGNPELRYVLLNEDMVSYHGTVNKIPMTPESFGNSPRGNTYGEGPWFFKRNNLYYMAYAAFLGNGNESLGYSTAPSPTGPWTYGGVLMTEEGGVFTNHPGIIDFRGRSFLFYHTGQLPGGGAFHRSVCVTEFDYNDDGSIDPVPKCRE